MTDVQDTLARLTRGENVELEVSGADPISGVVERADDTVSIDPRDGVVERYDVSHGSVFRVEWDDDREEFDDERVGDVTAVHRPDARD